MENNSSEIFTQQRAQIASKHNLIINLITMALLASLFIVMALPFCNITEVRTSDFIYEWGGSIYRLINSHDIFIALIAVVCVVFVYEVIFFLFYFMGRANAMPHKYISKKVFQISHFITAGLILLTTIAIIIYMYASGLNGSKITVSLEVGFNFFILIIFAIVALKIVFGIRINKNFN